MQASRLPIIVLNYCTLGHKLSLDRHAIQEFTPCSQTNDKDGTREASSHSKIVAGWCERRTNNRYRTTKNELH